MPEVSFEHLVWQTAFAFIFCLLFKLIGNFLFSLFNFADEDEANAKPFYSLLLGMLFSVFIWSIACSLVKTIFVLASLAALLLIRRRSGISLRKATRNTGAWRGVVEMFVYVWLFVVMLNLLPEGEAKQKDSFFYLKIAEVLSSTGQENANHYYNLLDPAFHGVEAYHYFELWLSSLLLTFTKFALPNIQVLRIVVYTVISVTTVYGIFYLFALIAGRRPSWLEKIASGSFIFFVPDLFAYLPTGITKYMVFNFESNYLERPNFRLIYLFFIPVLAMLWKKQAGNRLVFFLCCLALMHPSVFLSVTALVATSTLLLIIPALRSHCWLQWKDLLKYGSFAIAYFLFYYFFPVKAVSAMYENSLGAWLDFVQKSYPYVAMTIATSFLYIALIIAIGWFLFRIFSSKEDQLEIKQHQPFFIFSGLIILVSVLIARSFDFMENLYQVAYNAYIMAAFVILVLFIFIVKRNIGLACLVLLLHFGGYIALKMQDPTNAFKDVYTENAGTAYNGKIYEETYVAKVVNFASTCDGCKGAYIADSNYYSSLYYSNRNPNVYHLPITYMIANNTLSNIDYCLSDSRAILYAKAGTRTNESYLMNAIERSYYHRTFSNMDRASAIREFVNSVGINYFITTGELGIDSILSDKIAFRIQDKNTGEIFYKLK